MTENKIHPDDIAAYIQDNGLLKNNIDLANMVNFFAELIVEECTTVIERNLFQGIGWNTSRAVRRHFGIESEE